MARFESKYRFAVNRQRLAYFVLISCEEIYSQVTQGKFYF